MSTELTNYAAFNSVSMVGDYSGYYQCPWYPTVTIPMSYPVYVPVVTPVAVPSDWIGTWKVVGHCHKCDNPIYAQMNCQYGEPPITKRSCECKP